MEEAGIGDEASSKLETSESRSSGSGTVVRRGEESDKILRKDWCLVVREVFDASCWRGENMENFFRGMEKVDVFFGMMCFDGGDEGDCAAGCAADFAADCGVAEWMTSVGGVCTGVNCSNGSGGGGWIVVGVCEAS